MHRTNVSNKNYFKKNYFDNTVTLFLGTARGLTGLVPLTQNPAAISSLSRHLVVLTRVLVPLSRDGLSESNQVIVQQLVGN